MDALKQMNIVIDVGKREVRHAMKKDNPSTHLESVAAILTEEQNKDSYPLPYISGILDKLRNSTYFSTLDLKHGYWQVPLAPASRPITAFTVPGKGLFQFKVLPFGLHSAGATFQRFLDSIIGPDLANIALVYLDDVVVLGRTFDEHLSNLHIVFSRLQEAGLQLQPAKCQFAKQSIKYLGHVVSASGIQTDPEKVAAISQISPPKSVKDVRSFLGAASWYRKFVPNFARITAPLVQLVKKNQRWFWGPEQDAAFQAVKDALRQSPVLICPDFSRPFQLHTDASEQGLGAVLIQEVDGMERAVAYASRTLNNLADSLSRNPLPCVVEENEEIFAVFQGNACPWYNKIYQAVTNSPSRYPEYLIHNEVLYRSFPGAHGETPWKLCIPKSERPRILKEIHDAPEAGHLGITKSIARAANRYYWPGMFREIRRYVQKCESCARHKFSQQKPFGQMLYSPVDCPWEQVSIDLMGPFPRSRKGFAYLLVLQDRFTKWTECQALRQATATAVVQVIKEKVIYRFGAPKRFICDNGSQFTSNQFRTAAKDWGVEIRFTAPYSPHQNPVERANRVIGPMLAQYIEDDQREWDVHLPQFMFAINTAKHETTGFSPAFLNFGRSLVPPSSLWREVHNSQDRPVPEAKDLVPELQKLRDFYQITKARLAEGFQRQRHGYNLRRRPFRPQIGQYVFKKEHVLSNAARNFSAKLAPKFSGPYKVIKTLSPNIVVLQVPGTRRMDRVHVKDLKLAPPESVAGPHSDTVPST
ncbi:RNase H-like domain found in reverse transcriptase [Popillia japonica]|uniref:RNA-directed DNA polymerase n=1 Tax=Popillia japonica TaxID=7064 RepID=A0AAW1JD12_POPJA